MKNTAKKILIVVEKQSQLDIILKSINLMENVKKYFEEYEEIQTLSMIGFGLYKFDYPQNKKYKEYPLTLPIKSKFHKRTDLDEKHYNYFKILKENNEYVLKDSKISYLDDVLLNESLTLSDTAYIHQIFLNFDDLLIFVDPDHSGMFSFMNFIKNVYGENWEDKFSKKMFLYNISYSNENISKSIIDVFENSEKTKEKFEILKKQAEIKYYFDYNYNLNSIVFTGQIVKNHYLSKDKNPNNEEIKYMSKYTVMAYLMLLNIVENGGKTIFRNSDIFNLMTNWKGTGKYKNQDIPKSKKKYYYCDTGSIGSPVSVSTIVDNLKNLGFIYESDLIKNTTIIEGKEIKYETPLYSVLKTNYFVKKMYDPDLTYRLENWKNNYERIDEVKKEIDNYIINMFSRQKDKNNKQFNH
jgi:hypothetical protein